MSKQVKFEGNKPFRVRIIGRFHPHRGVEGTCYPDDLVHPGSVKMAKVRFDYGHLGADGAFAAEHELERVDA